MKFKLKVPFEITFTIFCFPRKLNWEKHHFTAVHLLCIRSYVNNNLGKVMLYLLGPAFQEPVIGGDKSGDVGVELFVHIPKRGRGWNPFLNRKAKTVGLAG